MSDGPTREEFAAFSDRLYTQMDDGFAGVHSRLDELNGRTRTGEIETGKLGVRIEVIEKAKFDHPRRRSSDGSRSSFFTKQEKGLIAFGITVVAALIKVAFMAGEAGLDMVKHLMAAPK